MTRPALGRSCRPPTSRRKKVIPGLQKAARCEVVAIASRDAAHAREVAAELGIPTAHGVVRGAARRPGRGRRLHPAAEPPARRVDDRRRACRQARPVREAAGADGRRGRADGRRLRGRGRPPDGGVHVPPPPGLGGGKATSSTPGGSARCARSRAGSRTTTTTPATSATRPRRAAARCSTSAATRSTCRGCCSTPSRSGSAPRSSASPTTGVDVLTSAILEFAGGTATFTCSTRVEPDQRVHIYGTTGRLDRDPVQHPARSADPDRRDGRRRSARRAGERDDHIRRPPTPTRSRPSASPPRSWMACHADAARGRGRQHAGHRADLRGGDDRSQEPPPARPDRLRYAPRREVNSSQPRSLTEPERSIGMGIRTAPPPSPVAVRPRGS